MGCRQGQEGDRKGRKPPNPRWSKWVRGTWNEEELGWSGGWIRFGSSGGCQILTHFLVLIHLHRLHHGSIKNGGERLLTILRLLTHFLNRCVSVSLFLLHFGTCTEGPLLGKYVFGNISKCSHMPELKLVRLHYPWC